MYISGNTNTDSVSVGRFNNTIYPRDPTLVKWTKNTNGYKRLENNNY